jgi:aerobic carbon-monoxide dehydrogenase small subunit
MKVEVKVKVNGEAKKASVEPRVLLAHFLRDELGLTGTHIGCDTTNCGACTVLLDGRPVKSCTVFAVQADGREVTTIEGLAAEGELDPVQLAFWEKHGAQCGFCTPGMILSSHALLARNPDPNDEEIKRALAGNLCRCTGYVKIIESVKYAAGLRKKGPTGMGLKATRPTKTKATERSGEAW